MEDATYEMQLVATVIEATSQPMSRRDPMRPYMDIIYAEVCSIADIYSSLSYARPYMEIIYAGVCCTAYSNSSLSYMRTYVNCVTPPCQILQHNERPLKGVSDGKFLLENDEDKTATTAGLTMPQAIALGNMHPLVHLKLVWNSC